MAGRGSQTFKKRQKEQQRREKQEEKRAKRAQRTPGDLDSAIETSNPILDELRDTEQPRER